MPEFGTHTVDGGIVTSTSQTTEQLSEAFAKPDAVPGEANGATDDSKVKPAGEAPPEVTEPKDGKRKTPRNDMQERMLDATRKESEAKKETAAAKARADEIEARAKRAEDELAKFQAGQRAKPPKAETVKTELPPKPLLADFETVEEWEEGVHAWREEIRGLKEAEEHKTKQAEASEKAFDDTVKAYHARIQEHLTKSPEFWSKIGDMVNWEPLSVLAKRGVSAGDLTPDVMIRAASVDYLLVSENPGPLAEYLAEHPEEFERLKAIHPRRLYGELGRIEERLSAATTATAKPKNSNAHLPVRPVTAGSPSATDSNGLPDPNLPDKEWARRREALEERRFKASH